MESKGKSAESSGTNEHFDITIERPKPSVFEDLLEILRKVLDYCFCCVSCGCYRPQTETNLDSDDYGMILLDSEKLAVKNLLQYLENDISRFPVLSDEHVRALCILTYSDNSELQKSAALCFTEISERMKSTLTLGMARPLVELLRSQDIHVQKAATLAISNFALKGPDANKEVMVTCGVLSPLIQLLHSKNVEIQCNTCGCITALATTDSNKQSIVSGNGIKPLLTLMKSSDLRVQRNAAGAVLNLTHLQSNRNDLVAKGGIPVLIELLHTSDSDIQYYSAAALSNIAVNEKHRAMMVAVGHFDIVKQLVKLLMSKRDKVKCQVCFALRNLASDEENQILIVKFGALPHLHSILITCRKETLSAAVACLRNLSIHKGNESALVKENFVPELCQIVCDSCNPEAQKHAAGTLRNLAVGDHVRILIDHDCLEALTFVLLDMESKPAVLSEVTAALAVLADEDDVKYKLINLHGGKSFNKLVTLATLSNNSEVQYNSAGTLGQLALIELPTELKNTNRKGIVLYIDTFLKSLEPSFVHIALWTLDLLLKDPVLLKAFRDHSIEPVIAQIQTSQQVSTIEELATSVLYKLQGGTVDTSNSSDD